MHLIRLTIEKTRVYLPACEPLLRQIRPYLLPRLFDRAGNGKKRKINV